MKQFLRQGFLILGSTVLLLLAWNVPLVISITRPIVAPLLPAVAAPAGENTVFYPRLGIAAPIIDSPGTSPLVEQSWEQIRADLRRGVNASEWTTAEHMVTFLTGHSSDRYPHPYASVFAGLGGAKRGDTFVVRRNGVETEYTVQDKQVVDPSNLDAFEKLAAEGEGNRVILVTCWPPLTTASRLIIVGSR